jgi:folate-dependent phosphoribosylglycinamide formyltransferase PurN
MKRLIERSQSCGSNCHVGLVISNKADVKGLETAASMGVETLVIPHGNCREEFELKVTKVCRNKRASFFLKFV